MIKFALPKGRLGDKAYNLLEQAGFSCRDYVADSRKLVFTDEDTGVSLFWVKPTDVSVYVEEGAADVGFIGKDILDEYRPDVYELLDMNMGKCRMCVAAKKGFQDDTSRPLKVATKFPNSATSFYQSKGREVQIIKLNGSIELAPVLGLSDVIFDIVETGTTLRENNLEVIDEAFRISMRLIANKASYKFKRQDIIRLTQKLKEIIPQ
ncbi:MAG: ATP phosphoribosyltransferase [Clostridia bacterium]|nr:ATP phosphoribosyltransferase [Clostridia bacterium]